MLDPKLLRSDPEGVASRLARRGFTLDLPRLLDIEDKRKSAQIEADRLRAERNATAKAIGTAKARGEDASALLAAGEALGTRLKTIDEDLVHLQQELQDLQLGLPNLLHESVPDGRD